MGDVAILEAAQHVDDGVHLTDIGEKLVAQPLALRGAADQAGDVDEFQTGGDDFHGFADRRQRLHPLIGHRDAADIGLDGAERIIRGLGGDGGRQRVEER
jgi:hypothetical protein